MRLKNLVRKSDLTSHIFLFQQEMASVVPMDVSTNSDLSSLKMAAKNAEHLAS